MKDNKKKMMVMALLALVVVTVGAFQFMGSGPAPAPAEKKKPLVASATPAPDAPKNPLVSNPLPPRDPFETPKELMPTPTPTPQPPQQPQNPRTTHEGRPIRNTEHMPVAIGGQLPDAMGNGGPMGPIGPGTQAPHIEATPAYSVVGIMIGAHPVAVFADSQGNQRLVPLGGSLDADTKVTGIEKGKVTLRFRGKTLRLDLGNPNAK